MLFQVAVKEKGASHMFFQVVLGRYCMNNVENKWQDWEFLYKEPHCNRDGIFCNEIFSFIFPPV